MKTIPNYYDILKISKDATLDEIKHSYKQLAKQHHPDKGGDKEKFQEIQTAYEILSDENKRKDYDNNPYQNQNQQFPFPFPFQNQQFPFQEQQQFPFQNQQFPFNIFNFNENVKIKRNDENYNCKISLKEVFFGTIRKFHIKRQIICEKCNIECAHCKGTGVDKNQKIQLGPFFHISNQPCVLCNGQGYKKLPFCDSCSNNGFKIKDIHIELLIPKGVENGKIYKYDGCGEQAIKNNEVSGNLIIIIEIIENDFFKRDNLDLIFEHQISFKESIIGKNILIPHIEETFVFDIRKFCIINPNKSYLIKDKGLQDELGNKGNLILKFKIIYTDKVLSESEIDILEKALNTITI